jgi:peptide/nickel transport system ATP-binding protein/oligopeptide transport system ATP-binding protein
MTAKTEPKLTVSGLVKRFQIGDGFRKRTLTAVDSVDFEVRAGETVALIGESGSGKSTVARCVARLVEPDAGGIVLDGQNLASMPRRQLWKAYRQLQMVFQDPASSLNPRMTARAAIEEPLRLHSRLDSAQRAAKVAELLDQVGLAAGLAGRYPRQLSGGECQRVAIARALAVEPSVLLLDEPTASLDVSVRRHILDLLLRIQQARGLGYLFISHDLGTVRNVADRVLVMYLGSIVEQGTVEEIFGRPTHPYTRALLSAETVAEFGRVKPARFRLNGEIGSALSHGSGCRLAPRCPLGQPSCVTSAPPPAVLSPTHTVLCPVTVASAPPGGDTARKEADLLIE